MSKFIAALGIVNWMAWGVISFFVGGTAFNGKVESDRYFFLNHSHYVQVSRSVFEYSRIHGYIAFGGLGLAILIGVTKILLKRLGHEAQAA